MQKFYIRGDAAYGSVRHLLKTSDIPMSKVRQFLHSKTSYTKFTPSTRKFGTMRAFARLKMKVVEWTCHVDKLAKKVPL